MRWLSIGLIWLVFFAAQNFADAAALTTIYKLDGGADGKNPDGPLLLKSGALYVAATQGGSSTNCDDFNYVEGCGVILQFTPPVGGPGPWTRVRIHSFTGRAGGATPFALQSLDTTNALYGVTRFGGSAKCTDGCGTVYKLTPPITAGAAWTKTVIHRFLGGNDGFQPFSSLVRAPDGALYGTTGLGGGQTSANCKDEYGEVRPTGCGTVYRLKPPASGSLWTKTVLARFNGWAGGGLPQGAGLLRDSSGVLYGLTPFGGQPTGCPDFFGDNQGCGIVFSVTPPLATGNAWTKKVLHTFVEGAGGAAPGGLNPLDTGFLVRDAAGALYGTTIFGGTNDAGVIFNLTPPTGAATQWTKRILYSFKGGKDGSNPVAGLVRLPSGLLYGTTYSGGNSPNCTGGCGTIFKLTPPSGSSTIWTKTTLANFNNANGANPSGPLVQTTGGAFYGLTRFGGNTACDYGCGTVFKWSP